LIIGVAGAVGLAWLLEQLIPTFVTSFEWSDLALVAVASVVMSTLASVIPARRIARVDPASVFRV
ncbi:MAG: FtsX-like permease family protein, partial [Acidimicrobiales bacterium]